MSSERRRRRAGRGIAAQRPPTEIRDRGRRPGQALRDLRPAAPPPAADAAARAAHVLPRVLGAARRDARGGARRDASGIVGRNGSGKSTLLQLVAGHADADHGHRRARAAASPRCWSWAAASTPSSPGARTSTSTARSSASRDARCDEAFGAHRGVRRHRRLHRPAGQDLLERHDRAPRVRRRGARDAGHPDRRRGARAWATPRSRASASTASGACSRPASRSCWSATAPNTIIEFCDRAVYLDRGRVLAAGPCREILEQLHERHVSRGYGRNAAAAARSARRPAKALRRRPRAGDAGAPRHRDPRRDHPPTRRDGDSVRSRTARRWTSSVDVAFHHDNTAPCFGIQIKSTDDIVLWTCTTQIMDLQPRPARPAGTRERPTCGGCARISAAAAT